MNMGTQGNPESVAHWANKSLFAHKFKIYLRKPSSPSEDYLAVLAGQRQWIATTNFAGCPGRPQIALRIAPCSLPRQSS